MTDSATARYQEVRAHEIADALKAAPHGAGRVQVRFDAAADAYAVRVTVDRQRFDLTMPAPGALYGLFRNGSWLGGMDTDSSASPVAVAAGMLRRIAASLGQPAWRAA